MVLFNYASKEITAKVVYYGPGLCGKTTNLQFIYDSLPSNNKSKMLSLATKTDRTLFFDFLPLDLGKIRGMRTKLQLYTVPGQVYYNSTRQLVLKGTDAVVFVADSQDFAIDANLESLQNLEDNLRRQGIRMNEIPLVLQYNKRDLTNILPVAELNTLLNKRDLPCFESVATTGLGVEQTLKAITQIVLQHLVKRYGLETHETSESQEIEVLNPKLPTESSQEDTVWAEDNVLATTVAVPTQTTSEYVVEDAMDSGEGIPVVPAELISSPTTQAEEPLDQRVPTSTFDELMERFETRATEAIEAAISGSSIGTGSAPAEPPPFIKGDREDPIHVPIGSIEIPLPVAPGEEFPAVVDSKKASERRSNDGLVREVTLPLNLSIEEIRNHRKLKIKITLDVNLLP